LPKNRPGVDLPRIPPKPCRRPAPTGHPLPLLFFVKPPGHWEKPPPPPADPIGPPPPVPGPFGVGASTNNGRAPNTKNPPYPPFPPRVMKIACCHPPSVFKVSGPPPPPPRKPPPLPGTLPREPFQLFPNGHPRPPFSPPLPPPGSEEGLCLLAPTRALDPFPPVSNSPSGRKNAQQSLFHFSLLHCRAESDLQPFYSSPPPPRKALARKGPRIPSSSNKTQHNRKSDNRAGKKREPSPGSPCPPPRWFAFRRPPRSGKVFYKILFPPLRGISPAVWIVKRR